ncbi:3-keto-5-aminohexanoate cleavage protein [Acidovorax sp. NCPPB 3576]|uniref:3-keto-5-aminohexanoate cleavage protein n=1 Tax=Acidovorax sp. NCPPB 3576 TaxID=2940488 RepID=UPI00234B10B7|nr:3-keto-5-aminohexanoate cleavage protein [Acidovorax sp. NCPPB 3576]WCM87291.1 3-keto-5-aminohexanoate cleavage protein [Acidovorax sp. NCPPB 3576]
MGAVPQQALAHEPKFLPARAIEAADAQGAGLADRLAADGWEAVPAGGLGLSDSLQAPLPDGLAGEGVQPVRRLGDSDDRRHLPGAALRRIASARTARELVLTLTSQGWGVVAGQGDLAWHADTVETYLPPALVAALRAEAPQLLDTLRERGWTDPGAGHWNPGRTASPHLPIAPDAIVAHSVAAVREGAAIVHLHTRDCSGQQPVHVPGVAVPVRLGRQANHIVESQYAAIVPRLHQVAPSAILNLSTSVRGGAADFESPVRRVHLRAYGAQQRAPEMGSFSPGPVIFQAGGGYENPPAFLAAQIAHCRQWGVRPEVEVFNGAILDGALGPYQAGLRSVAAPLLFMLVVGVDQHRRLPQGGVRDDSLLPVQERKDILRLLADGSAEAFEQALAQAVARLRPVVARIRAECPGAKVSALVPGPMIVLLPRLAVALGLDGVRVGLEDALNVPDPEVAGGWRRGTTAEQVRYVREQLQALGATVLTAEETRVALDMPHPDVAVLQAAIARLQPLAATVPLDRPRAMAEAVLAALSLLKPAYAARESRFLDALEAAAALLPADPQAQGAADLALAALRDHGLYARFFVEERDRYPREGAAAFRHVYPLQALNFVRELLAERQRPGGRWDAALQAMATEAGLPPHAYQVRPAQFKGQDLRFLEFLTSIPCRYTEGRTDIAHTAIRGEPGYSAAMAVLFEAIHERAVALRAASEAEPKNAGIRVYPDAPRSGGLDVPADMDVAAVQGAIARGAWIVLPSTPTTHYPEGLKLSTGLTATFARFLERTQATAEVLGIAHSGIDADGTVLIESSMLHNRFTLNTKAHAQVVSHSSRLIYERVVLPRLVAQPRALAWNASGLVERDAAGMPMNRDGRAAGRLSFQGIEDLARLHFLAHSSGIATIQQIDNAARTDLQRLGYSVQEQEEIFNRSVALSFASACDVNLSVLGTPIVDVTALNDVRSVAGTTTPDYLCGSGSGLWSLAPLIPHRDDEAFRYGNAHWILRKGEQKKLLLRLAGVVLREDPVRLHDGHSIRRYLEGAPASLVELVALLQTAPASLRADMLLRQHFARHGAHGHAHAGPTAQDRAADLALAGGAA